MNRLTRTAVRIVFSTCCAIVLCSCSASPKSIIKKNQADYDKKLANLEIIASKIADQKFNSEVISIPATGPTLALDDIYPSYNYKDGTASAQLFSAEDLKDPDETNTGMHLFSAKSSWQMVRKMVKDGVFPESKEDAVKALKRFAGWRYAIVLRSSKVESPCIAGTPVLTKVTDKASYSNGSFTTGTLEGHVLLYDLEDGAFLGGFPVNARSSDQIDVNTYGGDDPNKQQQRALIYDFTRQIRTSISFGLFNRISQDRLSMNGSIRADIDNTKSTGR